MATHADKTTSTTPAETSHRKTDAPAQFRFEDRREQTAAQERLRMMGRQSPQARQLMALQALAATSPPTHRLVAQRGAEVYSDAISPGKLAKKTAQGMPDVPLGLPALKFQRYRKLNRLGGELVKRSAVPHVAPVVTAFAEVLNTVKDTGVIANDAVLAHEPTETASLEAIEQAKDLSSDERGKRDGYETYSMLGPLNYWLKNGQQDERIETALHGLRQTMAERDGISIVAHRGHGPTNRTRGGLIGQDDPRRLRNPAENSISAFNAAFRTATTDKDAPALDGVECDVFLSSDNDPMLSHEGNVREQLSKAQQDAFDAAGYKADDHIENLSTEGLKAIKRTADADSNFITLGEFLTASVPTATAYYTATGRPFRIEIEMKGSPKSDPALASAEKAAKAEVTTAKAVVTQANDDARNDSKKPKAEQEANTAAAGAAQLVLSGKKELLKQARKEMNAQKPTYSKNLTATVSKTISQFKKTHALPYWAIILFNSKTEIKDGKTVAVDVLEYQKMRKSKTNLGGLYTGLGHKDAAVGKDNKVDELRMTADEDNLKDMQEHGGDFIITYVPGAERAFETPNAALGELTGFPNIAINTPASRAKTNGEMTDKTGKQASIIKKIMLASAGNKKMHLLTDIPANAKKYKADLPNMLARQAARDGAKDQYQRLTDLHDWKQLLRLNMITEAEASTMQIAAANARDAKKELKRNAAKAAKKAVK